MATAPTTILYIAGPGRSASTLLGCILGQLPGFCFVGETKFRPVPLATHLCGCGARLAECGFWAAVWRAATGDGPPLRTDELFGVARGARWRHLPDTLLPGGDRRLIARLQRHWGGDRLHAAIAEVAGARVIVDSSKDLPYGRMLSRLPGLDVRVLHLVRDPRAVVHSWTRAKTAPDRSTGFMKRLERGPATLFWVMNNIGAEAIRRHAPDRYLRLRYEDFVRRPRDAMAQIARLAGQAPDGDAGSIEPPFTGDHSVVLQPTHSIWGNPDRLRTGALDLAPDEEWRAAMPLADRRFVTALTWPLLVRYGYPIKASPARSGRWGSPSPPGGCVPPSIDGP